MKQKYYFTFKKKDGFPFKDGYVIIWAENYYTAKDEFNKLYPSETGEALYTLQFSEAGWEDVDSVKWGIRKDSKYCHGEFGKDE